MRGALPQPAGSAPSVQTRALWGFFAAGARGGSWLTAFFARLSAAAQSPVCVAPQCGAQRALAALVVAGTRQDAWPLSAATLSSSASLRMSAVSLCCPTGWEECVGLEWPEMPWGSIHGDISLGFFIRSCVGLLSDKVNLQIFFKGI